MAYIYYQIQQDSRLINIVDTLKCNYMFYNNQPHNFYYY